MVIVLIALLQLVCPIIYKAIFSYVGGCLTERLRSVTYLKMLKMPLCWFDRPSNSSGTLATRLAMDCKYINNLVTIFIAVILQSVSLIITGLIVAFVFDWRTALVGLVLLPLIIGVGLIRMMMTNGFS